MKVYFTATLWTDGELLQEDIQVETVDLLQQLGPWGQKSPAPIFEGSFRILDLRWLKEVHLKLRVALDNGQVVDAIAFNAADKYQFNEMNPMWMKYVWSMNSREMRLMAMSAYNFRLCIWSNNKKNPLY